MRLSSTAVSAKPSDMLMMPKNRAHSAAETTMKANLPPRAGTNRARLHAQERTPIDRSRSRRSVANP